MPYFYDTQTVYKRKYHRVYERAYQQSYAQLYGEQMVYDGVITTRGTDGKPYKVLTICSQSDDEPPHTEHSAY